MTQEPKDGALLYKTIMSIIQRVPSTTKQKLSDNLDGKGISKLDSVYRGSGLNEQDFKNLIETLESLGSLQPGDIEELQALNSGCAKKHTPHTHRESFTETSNRSAEALIAPNPTPLNVPAGQKTHPDMSLDATQLPTTTVEERREAIRLDPKRKSSKSPDMFL